MSGFPPVLDDAGLAEYVERLRSLGVPVDALSEPGLSDAEMDEMTAAVGLVLPGEARVLWRWHDGVPEDGRANPLGAFRKRFLRLSEAVNGHRQSRKVVLDVAKDDPVEDDPDMHYRPSWLPLLGPQHPLVIDCAVGVDEPTPLRLVDLEDPDEPFVRARSLGEAVRLWSNALDRGLWKWDAAKQGWEVDLSSLAPIERASPLL
jgi:cell wall assembly regulator SMI1